MPSLHLAIYCWWGEATWTRRGEQSVSGRAGRPTMSITIRTFLSELSTGSDLEIGPDLDENAFLAWWTRVAEEPADVFAIAIALAQRSVAYAAPHLASTADDVVAIAEEWGHAGHATDRIRQVGSRIFAARDVSCEVLPEDVRRAILELVGVSDCLWGLRRRNLPDEERLRLDRKSSLSRLDPDRIRVLPKFRTPQVGLTVRSWSHHLAAIVSEVPVRYRRATLGLDADGRDQFRLLVYAWPFDIRSTDFVTSGTDRREFSYFHFAPAASFDDNQIARLGRILDVSPPIDLVVLPEAAVTDAEFNALSHHLESRGCALLAGVRSDRRNEVRFAGPAPFVQTVTQYKHHRWKLDESQIARYELGSQMAPHKRWWEYIEVSDKSLMVIDTGELSMIPLVCEDLARQEPIAPIIRTLGPSLVIALLLDGPQLPGRWSARYATVLAEDPGSSVLTVSALGMVKDRRRRRGTQDRLRSVSGTVLIKPARVLSSSLPAMTLSS